MICLTSLLSIKIGQNTYLFSLKKNTLENSVTKYIQALNNKDKNNGVFFHFLIMLKALCSALVISFLYRYEGTR